MTKLDSGRVRAILRDALDVWARGSKLQFQEVYDPKADIQVLFVGGSHGDGRDFDGPSGVLAHAFYPAEGRGGDAHFDDEEDWSLEESGRGTSLMDVAVHEFGHSIGLGHSSVESAIMYPWFYGEKKYKTLPEDDRIAVEELYGAVKRWGVYEKPVIKATTTTTTTPRSYYPEPTKSREQEIEERRLRIQAEREQQERIRRLEAERRQREDAERRRVEKLRLDKERRERERQEQLNRKRNTKPTTSTKHYHGHRFQMDVPDMCNTTYDAVTMFRDEMYIFKSRYLWRIGRKGLYPGSPHEITQVWNISNDLTHVDAAYENKYGRMVFFVGKLIYSFNGHDLDRGYPKPLAAIGLPFTLQKIDDIWVWGHNNQTFIFSGTKYWVFDEDTNSVVLDYPRNIRDFWTGIPIHIDAAFQYRDGITYFFKGKSFWQFNDKKNRSQYKKPESSAVRWMGCPQLKNTLSNEVTYDVETHHESRTAALSSASNAFIDFTFWISISCLIFGKLFT